MTAAPRIDHILTTDSQVERHSGRLTGKIELKLNMEALTKCAGSCGGCLMTAEERAAGSVWEGATLDRAGDFVERFVAEQADALPHITEISLNCGQGDYFLLQPGQVDPFVATLRRMGGGLSTAFITASAVTNSRHLAVMLDAWYDAAERHEQALLIDLVLDPVKTSVGQFREIYADNLTAIRRRFGGVDLNINIGPDTVAALTPDQLHDFLADNDFGIGTINLVPTFATGAAFALSWEAIVDWLIAFAQGWDAERCGYEINLFATFGKAIELVVAQGQMDQPMGQETLSDVVTLLSRELYIDHEGRVSFTQAGVGDGPLGLRNGFKPRLSMLEPPEGPLLPRIEALAKAQAARIVNAFLRDEACAACRFAPVCARTGVVGLRQVLESRMPRSADGCPIGVKRYLEAVEAYMATGRDLCSTAYSALTTFVQKGFASPRMDNATEMVGVDTPVRFDAVAKG